MRFDVVSNESKPQQISKTTKTFTFPRFAQPGLDDSTALGTQASIKLMKFSVHNYHEGFSNNQKMRGEFNGRRVCF